MYDKTKNTLSASTEIIALYIDLSVRKVTKFEDEKKIIMNNLINKYKTHFKSDNLKLSSKLKN